MQTAEYNYHTEPFAHQVDAVTFGVNTYGSNGNGFALFMSQGTGKTKTTIDFVENGAQAGWFKRCMIIAPNGVHRQWERDEIPLHGFLSNSTFVWKSDKKHVKDLAYWLRKDEPCAIRYLCVNVEAFSLSTYLDQFRAFCAEEPTCVVIDEATSIKNPDAARTNNILNALSNVVKSGRRVVARTPITACRIILTGTPEAKGPYGLWSMLEFVQPNFWGMSYYAFRGHYGMEKQVYFPGMTRATLVPLKQEDFDAIRRREKEGMSANEIAIDLNIPYKNVEYIMMNPQCNTPYKNLVELKQKLATIAFTVTKEECLDLPPKIFEQVLVPMSDEQRKVYNQFKKDAYAIYLQGALDATTKATIELRLRQIAGGFFPTTYDLTDGVEQELLKTQSTPIGTPAKAQAVLRRLEDDGEFPVIIATAFRAEAEYLEQYLLKHLEGRNIRHILGGMSKSAREEVEREFKEGLVDILIATEQTIAKGYNFQRSHLMYMYSQTFNSEDRMQLVDRIYRIGQTETCVYVDFVTENSADERVLRILNGDEQFQKYMQSKDDVDFCRLWGLGEKE